MKTSLCFFNEVYKEYGKGYYVPMTQGYSVAYLLLLDVVGINAYIVI